MTQELKPMDGNREWEEMDPALRACVADFKASVHAWSDAAYGSPRPVSVRQPGRLLWRRAGAWALSLALALSVTSGGLYERHQRHEQARLAAEREAARQSALASERTLAEERELAEVDSEVSREVPSALEPLAALTGADQAQ